MKAPPALAGLFAFQEENQIPMLPSALTIVQGAGNGRVFEFEAVHCQIHTVGDAGVLSMLPVYFD